MRGLPPDLPDERPEQPHDGVLRYVGRDDLGQCVAVGSALLTDTHGDLEQPNALLIQGGQGLVDGGLGYSHGHEIVAGGYRHDTASSCSASPPAARGHANSAASASSTDRA